MTVVFPIATIAIVICVACAIAILVWVLQKVGLLPAGINQPPFSYVIIAAVALFCLWLLWLVASAFGA